jgi:hypothetical protein
MAPEVAAAWVAGLFSVAAAVVAYLQARSASQAQQRIETLRSDLEEQSSEKEARRQYEYEARKRLYSAVAPAIFQLGELVDAGLTEIGCLCDPSLVGRYALTPEEREALRTRGWIGSTAYEFVSAAYALICPLAIYRILQRRITSFDLSLDAQVYAQWCLIRASYQASQRDGIIARLDPAIDYEPDVPNWRIRRSEDPRRRWWQGVTRGRLDTAIDLLLVDDQDGQVRVATFGEFEKRFKQAARDGGEEEQTLGVFANALFDYNPKNRPVYFRLLAIEAVIFRAVLRTGGRIDTAQTLPEVVPWLRLDGDLARQFEQAGGEPIERLRGVTDKYLELAVAPAFVPPITTSTG